MNTHAEDSLKESSFEVVTEMRDPLAVLLLSTDILRQYGHKLDRESLRHQHAEMHKAAAELKQALTPDSGAE